MEQLEQAADRFGVERQFWDIWGNPHQASAEVLRAILKSLGVNAESDDSLRQALAEREQEERTHPLPATIVVSQRDPSLPAALTPGSRVKVTIDFEDGTSEEGELPLRRDLPLGYHTLRLASPNGMNVSTRLIVCPDRAYQPEWLEQGRGAGLAISLYGVRSDRNWGCGDCTDLAAVVDWAAGDLRVSFVALNPLHAIPNRQPYNTSPYLPNSSFYRNHIYLDIERIPEFAASTCARRLLASPAIQAEIAALRASQYVEYERVSRLKFRFLKLLFRQFSANELGRHTERAAAFNAYVEREGDLLHLYAVHSALDEALHKSNPSAWNWQAWPEPYQRSGSPETQEFARRHWRSVLLHKYIQWQLDIQFAEVQAHARRRMSIGLYHDLALATDRYGSDLWAHGNFYANGCRVGSPPDNFAPKGQDWSFPPPNSVAHFDDGYRLFAESIRKASAHGGALRIDHVMRFFRLYWIPDGKDATEGTYVLDRYHDLIRVLALESQRNKFIVVGEDLGTVPDLVRQTLSEFGVLSYRLFYFERDSDGRFHRPDEYPRQALVSASTHDLPTLAGFWQGADIEARRAVGILSGDDAYRKAIEERAVEKQRMLNLLHELGLLSDQFPRDARQIPELTGELHAAIIGFLSLTPSALLLINQEDLFKDLDQQNLPGTTAEHPNWRHKMKYKVEELSGDRVRGYSGMLRSWLEKTGRARD